MRVPTISVYNQAAYQLNSITKELQEANEEVSSQKCINECSDDPIGMCQVLGINSSIESLDQTLTNVNHGQMVLTQAETALNGVADQLTDTKLMCSQMASASASPQDRADAAQTVDNMIESMLDLANTQVNGIYVFGGTQNDVPPFAYDDPDNPTAVVYQGNDTPACVKTAEGSALNLDCCGSDIFYEDEIIVDSTNNQLVFQEDPGLGQEGIKTLEAEIPPGTYTREELAAQVEKSMEEASLESGYGLGYEVNYDETSNCFSVGDDGTSDTPHEISLIMEPRQTSRLSSLETTGFEDSEPGVELINPGNLDQMTPEPEGSVPMTFTYTEEGTWLVDNDPGYGIGPELEGTGQVLELDTDHDGVADVRIDLGSDPEAGDSISFDIVPGFENDSLLPDLGFDDNRTTFGPATSDLQAGASIEVIPGENDTIDFTETLHGQEGDSTQLCATMPAGTYDDPHDYARAVELAMEAESTENGNRVDYQVTYNETDQSFSISESGDIEKQLASFDLLFNTGAHSDASACSCLGFSAQDTHCGPATGDEADWGFFATLYDLEEALATNDVDGIQRAMTRLDSHYNAITTSITEVGMNSLSLTITETSAIGAKFALTEQRSEIEDTDAVESSIRLQTAQTTYEAALSSTATILGISLVDYM